MNKLCAAAAVAIAAAAIGAAAAGTPDGRFAVTEPGRASCEAYLKARTDRSPAFGLYLGFIQGYVTAANRYEPDTFDLAPWQTPQAFALILANHCQSAPKERLAAVAQKLVVTMRPTRLAEFSDLVLVGEGKSRRPVYKAVLSQTQNALLKKGLYQGPVDGRYSPPLKVALQEFQRSAKLQPTGLPDTATLWLLLRP